MSESIKPKPTPKVNSYQSSQKLSRLLTSFLALGVIVSLFALYSYYFQYEWMQRLSGDISYKTAREMQSNLWIVLPPSLSTLIFLVTSVLFLVWIHRAYSNLQVFGTQGLQHSPGWAVGWWFIPIFNLFRPYQVMKEIYLASDPKQDAQSSIDWKKRMRSTLFPWWWLFWIFSWIELNLKGDVGNKIIKIAIWIGFFATLAGAIAGLLLIFIIKDIDRRQGAKSQSIPTEPMEAVSQAQTGQEAPEPSAAGPTPKTKKWSWVTWFIIGTVVIIIGSCAGLAFFANYWFYQSQAKKISLLKNDFGDYLTLNAEDEIVLKRDLIGCTDFLIAYDLAPLLKNKKQAEINSLIEGKKCHPLVKGSQYDLIDLRDETSYILIYISDEKDDYVTVILRQKAAKQKPSSF